jgi:16S rRNA (uracil1498-N3)-methyltransferase
MALAKIRLHVDQPLGPGQPVPLTREQAHYLFTVMRLAPGDPVLAFNGRDGEWLAAARPDGRRGGTLDGLAFSRPAAPPPDLWLLFAPIRKERTAFIVEKAVEMGVAAIRPVRTAYTNAERLRTDRLRAHAVEAAEQCGATTVPEVADLHPLEAVLADWPRARRLMLCDEALAGHPAGLPAAGAAPPGPWAILIGPEGGFSEAERARLAALPFVTRVSLGPRVLRADTAAVAALTLWQTTLGDWR